MGADITSGSTLFTLCEDPPLFYRRAHQPAHVLVLVLPRADPDVVMQVGGEDEALRAAHAQMGTSFIISVSRRRPPSTQPAIDNQARSGYTLGVRGARAPRRASLP